jgi:hypothetical protein
LRLEKIYIIAAQRYNQNTFSELDISLLANREKQKHTGMISITRNILIMVGGIVALGVAAILYLALGLTVVQSYSNESNYKKTTCTVRAVEIHKMSSKEDWYRCPWKCAITHTPDGLKTYCELSEFPCLRIVVDVSTKNGLKSAILHENPEKMVKYTDCSTYYCDQDSVVNDKEVNKFRRRYGNVGTNYPCYFDSNSLQSDDYDDDGQEHALLKLTYNEASYVNSLLWPSLTATAGLLMIGYALFNIFQEKNAKKSDKRKILNNL